MVNEIKVEHALILVIVAFLLYHFIGRCCCLQKCNRIQRFSIGIPKWEWWDRIKAQCLRSGSGAICDVIDASFEFEPSVEVEPGDDAMDDPSRDSAAGGAASGAAGGAAGGGAADSAKSKILMDSYKICNPSITDDILSQLRCQYKSGCVPEYRGLDPKSIRCHMSPGIFQGEFVESIYNIEIDITEREDFRIWYELEQYLNSGDHYLASLSIPGHTFLLEFKNRQFRILSSWEEGYSFFDFPSISKWGNFIGHPDWNEFTKLMTILNGGSLLNPDGSKITTLPSNDHTWTWTDEELKRSGEIFEELFSESVNMQKIIDIKKLMESGWRGGGYKFEEYPKGMVIRYIDVFLKINGLK